MRKNINSLAFLIVCLIAFSAYSTPSDHRRLLKTQFPYGLLGDDYGILTVNDLALNACIFKPESFPPPDFISPYEYWQCFDTKSISLSCGSSGVPDEHEGMMGLVIVRAFANQVKHRYIEHRPWPIDECRSLLKRLTALMKNSRNACISGSFIYSEVNKAGVKTSNWIFDRFKTSKGCLGQPCDFNEKIKKTHCPNLQASLPVSELLWK